MEFSAPEGASMMRRIVYFCFVNRGRGVDPSYITTLIPLVVVPIVSKLTRANPEGKDRFYALVSAEERLEGT